MISARSKGNVIVSVTYFTHFRPKWLLRMLWSWRNRAGLVACDGSFPCLKLTAVGRGCCKSTLGYSQPQGTVGLFTWAGGTYSQDCYWRWQHCRVCHLYKMGSFKARVSKTDNIQELEDTDYQPKSIRQPAEYKKFLHTAKLFKSKGLIAW